MSTIAALNRDGHPIEIDSKHVDVFRAGLRGTLLTAADAAYDDSRSIWNAMIDRKPALIARCANAASFTASKPRGAMC